MVSTAQFPKTTSPSRKDQVQCTKHLPLFSDWIFHFSIISIISIYLFFWEMSTFSDWILPLSDCDSTAMLTSRDDRMTADQRAQRLRGAVLGKVPGLRCRDAESARIGTGCRT